MDFLTRLKRGPILCDGAMGTLLYSKGVFINRCYDELNLSQPDLIAGIHHEYVRAGAEILETNTFGANSFRLQRHGCADKIREINRAGIRLARQAADKSDVYVAGSVGPLGVRIEPLGKIAFEEARASFRDQISAMNQEGVDLLILETFGYLEELHQAILAAREVNSNIPIVAQVTIDEDGNCLDGSVPETYAGKLAEWGADVIGCNCSVGPVAMLEAMEHVRRATSDAALRATKRRNASQCRGPKHLSLLAGVHGELRPQVRRPRCHASSADAAAPPPTTFVP